MDLLLIFLSIAGVVFAAVMLLLGSRTMRMERESDARVGELQARATGSVLFAPGEPDESADATELPLMDVVAPLRLQSHDHDLDLAWDEMLDETVEKADAAESIQPGGWAPEVQTPAHPFVLTVPATADGGRVFSFARLQHRSRT